MENNEKLAKLKALFTAARKAGLCYSQRDFANLIGKRESTISSALHGTGNALTDKLLFTTEKALREHGVTIHDVQTSAPVVVGDGNFFADNEEPDHIGRALDMLKAELDAKNALVERLVAIIEKK